MNNKYVVGDFGYFDFSIRKKDKYDNFQTTYYQLWATVTQVEERNIEIVDNDGFPYIITKRRIKVYNKENVNK